MGSIPIPGPMEDSIASVLLEAPDTQLDASMKPLIEKWSKPPTSLQVLEVLDQCIYASLASGFVVQVLQIEYDRLCKEEGTTHEENIGKATWRQKCQ